MKRIWVAAVTIVLLAGATNDAGAMAFKDIAGQWCGELSDDTFAPQSLTVNFHNGNPAKVFKVTKYTYTDVSVRVDWISSNGKELFTIFAEFGNDGTMAQQKSDVGPRRSFKRCRKVE